MKITTAQFKKIEKMDLRKVRIEENGNVYVGNAYAMVNTKMIKDGIDERNFELKEISLLGMIQGDSHDYLPIVPRIYVGRCEQIIIVDKDKALSQNFECVLDSGYKIRIKDGTPIMSFWLDDELMAMIAMRDNAWKIPEQLQ